MSQLCSVVCGEQSRAEKAESRMEFSLSVSTRDIEDCAENSTDEVSEEDYDDIEARTEPIWIEHRSSGKRIRENRLSGTQKCSKVAKKSTELEAPIIGTALETELMGDISRIENHLAAKSDNLVKLIYQLERHHARREATSARLEHFLKNV